MKRDYLLTTNNGEVKLEVENTSKLKIGVTSRMQAYVDYFGKNKAIKASVK